MSDKTTESTLSIYRDGEFNSLLTTKYIFEGTSILVMVGEVMNRTRYTIEQNGKHYIDELIMYMNHSCEPNCYIKDRVVYAKRNIDAYEHLTFDYLTTESQISNPFDCLCGSANCRGKVV